MVEHVGNGAMVRGKQFADTDLALTCVEPLVAGDDHTGTAGGNQLITAQWSVAVDDQPRIAARHQRRIEQLGEATGDLQRTWIPGDMAGEGGSAEAKPVEAARNAVGGVIADDDGMAGTMRVVHRPCRRLVGGEESRHPGAQAHAPGIAIALQTPPQVATTVSLARAGSKAN
ncbi:hypothetical protein HQ394_17710 [Defluviicoccus vanus]|uniref:Uncharacterized protein n=1 Tax=Defluviicoccus vanus TaxID=111831 RepID=A0A7H1N527_9PROT|nr:hypothetical protein [Defluviicoccus vanus]QNT70813.1 hypothetical protein HQ394_17710 [Defluviicoccus vanus]